MGNFEGLKRKSFIRSICSMNIAILLCSKPCSKLILEVVFTLFMRFSSLVDVSITQHYSCFVTTLLANLLLRYLMQMTPKYGRLRDNCFSLVIIHISVTITIIFVI